MSKVKYNRNGVPKYNQIRKMCWGITKYIKRVIVSGLSNQHNNTYMLASWIYATRAGLFSKAQVKKMFLKGTKINY